MKIDLCGYCNVEIPIGHVRAMIQENDGTITHYCIKHENKIRKLKPCLDCGHHRKLCNECKEGE